MKELVEALMDCVDALEAYRRRYNEAAKDCECGVCAICNARKLILKASGVDIRGVSIKQRHAIELACRNYIETIWQLSNGKIDAGLGEMRRREWHEQLLELTGLSAFVFSGLPAWFQVDNVENASRRLYNALLEQMKED